MIVVPGIAGIIIEPTLLPQPSVGMHDVTGAQAAGWQTAVFRCNGCQFWQPADGISNIAPAVKISSRFIMRISSTKRFVSIS